MSDTSKYWFNKIVFRDNEPIKHIISERDFIACKADIVTHACNSFISSSQKELFLDEVQAFGETISSGFPALNVSTNGETTEYSFPLISAPIETVSQIRFRHFW